MTNEEMPYKDKLLDELDFHNGYVTPLTLLGEYRNPEKEILDVFSKNELLSLIEANNIVPIRDPNVSQSAIVIWMVGAGGVASWVLPQLLKVLYNYKSKSLLPINYKIYVMDGDEVSESNILRQNFIPSDVGENKAKVLASRYNEIYEGIEVLYIDKYMYSSYFLYSCISERNVPLPEEYQFSTKPNYLDYDELTTPRPSYVFNMMDNELSKHMLDYHLATRYSFRGVRYFCTGCDVNHGLVFTSLIGVQPLYTQYFKDTTFIKEDAKIETHSCAEVAEELTIEQSFDSNGMAANLVVTLFSNVLIDKYINTFRIDFISTGAPGVTYRASGYIDQCLIQALRSNTFNAIESYHSRYGALNKNTKACKKYREIIEFLDYYSLEDFRLRYGLDEPLGAA